MNRPFKLAGGAVALACAALFGAPASAVTLAGITSSNEVALIDTANTAAATRVAITGLAAGDRFVGIDTKPSNGLIYGITLSSKIYTLNAMSGATSFVANLPSNFVNSTLGYGIDFNPVADFSGAASLRFVSTNGDNYAINALTGAVTVATSIAAGYAGVAYTNSAVNPPTGPTSTSLYYINSNTDMLAVATSGFNAPTINNVGSLGVDSLKANGFEILADGSAFAALNVDNGTSLVTGIYSINLGTGAATQVGLFNGTLSGLTAVTPVPEPGSYALMLAGLAAVGWVARRRK